MTDDELLKKQAELDARRLRWRESQRPEPKEPLERVVDDMMNLARKQRPEPTPEQIAAELDARMEEAARIGQRARSDEAISGWLRIRGVGARHRELAYSDELIPAAARDWAERFPHGLKGESMVLAGPPGTGKTTTAIWIMRQAYLSGGVMDRRWIAPEAQFISSAELFAKVFAKESLARFEETELLIIDDWGMAYETEWPLAMMDRLIDRRWSENRATVVTTNLQPFAKAGPESFESRYPRVFSRLADCSGPGVVALARQDLRRRKAS